MQTIEKNIEQETMTQITKMATLKYTGWPTSEALVYAKGLEDGAKIGIAAGQKYQSLNLSSSPTGYLIDGKYFSAADFAGQTVNEQNMIVALWGGPQVKVGPDELVEAMLKAIENARLIEAPGGEK